MTIIQEKMVVAATEKKEFVVLPANAGLHCHRLRTLD
ncbi:hypothetical protein ACVIHB_000488 [Bradyrhizobium liaoningense]